MCSRFTLTSKPDLVGRHFGLREIEAFPARYNIAPSQPIAIIRTGYTKKREFVLVRWGLLPDWVKEPEKFSILINARAETVQQKPSFRAAVKYRRCLIPANGFYEWQGAKGQRQPNYIHSADDKPLGFAGLWEHWMSPDGAELESAAIITTRSNKRIARLHDRMPVIIAPEYYEEWLDCSDGRAEETSRLLRPAPDDLLRVHEVGAQVNNPLHEGPDLLLPKGQQELF